MEIKLSIIIPVYNTEKYIRKCVDSCLNQDINSTEYEIILVDDGSTDNSLSILLEYEKNHQNVIVLKQKNSKQGAARNHGLKYAKGKSVWYVDSDDFIELNILKNLLQILKETNVDVLAFDSRMVDENGSSSILAKFPFKENVLYKNNKAFLEDGFIVSPPRYIIKRDFILKNQLFFIEDIYYEDYEHALMMFLMLDSFIYINKIYYNVLERVNSTTRSRNFDAALGIVTSLKTIIKKVNKLNLSEIELKIIGKHIAISQNNLLRFTSSSKKYFQKATQLLKEIDDLPLFLRISGSRSHLFQYKMLQFPNTLRFILNIYYKE